MYNVLLESRTKRELERLPSETFERIIIRIKALAENPRPQGCRKIAGSKGDWRIRVGDHRVVYEIDDKMKEVRIMRVRHRREVYR